MSRQKIQTGSWLPPTTMSDVLTPIGFDILNGWKHADLSTSLAAFRRSAEEILNVGSGFRRDAKFGGVKDDWNSVCKAALTTEDARQFFETHFQAFHVTDAERPQGLFTGYYEPLLQGSLTQSKFYPVPVYAKPKDLVAFTEAEVEATGLSYGRRSDGKPQSYDTRKDIENGALVGKAEILCWLSDWVDAFFMHVQGQGRVELDDGRFIRLSYSGKAGHPYSGIGHILIKRGIATPDKMSMQVLRNWMCDNPNEARELMWNNKSYIFFQRTEVTDTALGGIGAAKVNLTPLHSLAVDRAYWMFGTPLWIETTLPPEAPKPNAAINRLMIAQDTGSAIKGIVRGDFFWGWGDDAIAIAGNMKSAGAMTALLPHAVAQKLGRQP
jgi:membrane-bound lytic murein transglycosylase A